MFVRGGDDACWKRSFDNGWDAWHSLGGGLNSAPAAVSRDETKIDVFARGGDDRLWRMRFRDGNWGEWGNDLGGGLSSGPAVSKSGTTRLDVFVQGGGNSLWTLPFDNGSWGDWTVLDGFVTATPAAVSSGDGTEVFVRGGYVGGRSKLFWRHDGNWKSLGGDCRSAPTVASWGPGRIDVFVKGGDSALWHLPIIDGSPGDWESLGGTLTEAPAAVSWGDERIDVFARGNDSALWHVSFAA